MKTSSIQQLDILAAQEDLNENFAAFLKGFNHVEWSSEKCPKAAIQFGLGVISPKSYENLLSLNSMFMQHLYDYSRMHASEGFPNYMFGDDADRANKGNILVLLAPVIYHRDDGNVQIHSRMVKY